MKHALAYLFALFLPLLALANEDSGDKEKAPPEISYVALTPALVGNYGTGPRLKYYKADIALRVSSKEANEKAAYHEPLIRNLLVQLFSTQTDETLNSVEGKEQLRQEALKQVQALLEAEEGKPIVDDLLFNNLIIQP